MAGLPRSVIERAAVKASELHADMDTHAARRHAMQQLGAMVAAVRGAVRNESVGGVEGVEGVGQGQKAGFGVSGLLELQARARQVLQACGRTFD